MGVRLMLGPCALALAAFAGPASALSYVQMRDEALVEAAPLVVLAESLYEIPGAVDAGGFVVDTRYVVDVSRAIKGRVATGALTLRVPGAQAAATGGVFAPGMPRLEASRPVLLFLRPRADGTYAPADLALGVFHEIELGGERVFARDLAGAHNVEKDVNASYNRPRNAARFVEWVSDYARGWRRPPDYFVAEDADAAAKFTQIRGGDNRPMRWFKFDSNQSETWYALQGGQNGMVRDEFALFQGAIAAWNNDTSSNVRYVYGGTTPSDAGDNNTDGKSAIVWNDAGNDIAGSYSCGAGGTLAFGGSYFTSSTTSFGGVPYHTAVEGFIVIQDGVACSFDGHNGEDGEETMAHELGHTLGLAHACGDGQSGACSGVLDAALMRAYIHSDGRGAALGVDDIAGISLIYPAAGGGGTPGGKPDPIFASGME